ncbi:MAG TPA: hypothetical protein PLJ47_00235 [Candidatus Hydrogenedentes bacterium]|nr:hypothetical protein [Candidatus Hydrogenedentota bacterium]HRK32990.1 hypothetical protein [Candidatus Hydrogenedentota bacterium]
MKTLAHKAIGIVAVLVGCAWIWTGLIEPAYRQGWSTGLIFTLTMLPLLSAPGFFALVYGVKVFRTPSLTNITRSVGVLFFLGAAFLASLGAQLFGEAHLVIGFNIGMVVLAFAMMPVYVWISRVLIGWSGLHADKPSDFFGKPFAVLLAIGVWNALREVIELTFGPLPGPESFVSSSIYVFGPMLIAFIFYGQFINWAGIENTPPKNTELKHT